MTTFSRSSSVNTDWTRGYMFKKGATWAEMTMTWENIISTWQNMANKAFTRRTRVTTNFTRSS